MPEVSHPVPRRRGRRACLIGALTTVVIACAVCGIDAKANSDDNFRRMLEAARTLSFVMPGNRAFVLEKQETEIAPVAIFFGYLDNRTACQQAADVLSRSGQAGTFKCHPVY
jgi:hypothetical protein